MKLVWIDQPHTYYKLNSCQSIVLELIRASIFHLWPFPITLVCCSHRGQVSLFSYLVNNLSSIHLLKMIKFQSLSNYLTSKVEHCKALRAEIEIIIALRLGPCPSFSSKNWNFQSEAVKPCLIVPINL